MPLSPKTRQVLKKYVLGEFSWKRVVRSTILIYLILMVFTWLVAPHKVFQPPNPSYKTGELEGQFFIPLPGGEKVAAMYLPGHAGSVSDEDRNTSFTLLYCHGNAEDLGDVSFVMELYQEHGYNIVAYDYRGYGLSSPGYGEARAYEEVKAVWDWLTQSKGLPPEQIIIYGRSMGGGPAVWLATQVQPAGLMLESAFTSAVRVITQVRIMPTDVFNNIFRIGDVRCPIMIIHSRKDKTIPFSHGKKLFAAARGSKQCLWLEQSGHDDLILADKDRYWPAIQAFLNTLNP
ncbi:alpha/beta hydrolase [Candidatus Sumerlaeota bacterium]|nr:alpha/beta hydrolase [Candidatus Sumerlaeota bacterium]